MAEQGLCSRRAAEQIIAEGRVKVNGHPVKVGDKMDPNRDVLHVDDERIYIQKNQQLYYLALYKPRGYVTTASDELGRKTVMELVSDIPARLYPVGRLDKDSEGLLLMTNDGAFAQAVTHPSGGISKLYRVTVQPRADEAQLLKMSSGVVLDDGTKTMPCAINVVTDEPGRTVMEMTLKEGKNREIRRMCEAVGLEVVRLKRNAEGVVKLLSLIHISETNLGDFVADGIYAYFNEIEELHCDIAVMNGGGIRADVPAGAWSFKTCKMVSPFGNVACLMSVTGKQIQDALEFAARFAGSGQENGGFLHVAGATYEIHTEIPNTVPTDEKNVWLGSATGTPRVQNVKIYDKVLGDYVPLDPERKYALAGMNYTLRNLGDGFAMFDGAELIKDYVSEDYLVMSSYAMMFGGADGDGLPHLTSANSPLADYPGYLLNYEDPHGAGRIQMIW